MTPDDLAAIRARDAECMASANLAADWMLATADDMLSQPEADRHALLVEVDRLTAGNTALVEAMKAVTEASDQMAKARHDCGAGDERARIWAGVEGLDGWPGSRGREVPGGWVKRAAVLRVIDGGEA